MSQPAWAAWIEIDTPQGSLNNIESQPAWAAWIEISTLPPLFPTAAGRSPHGLRGLKSLLIFLTLLEQTVAARMGCVD